MEVGFRFLTPPSPCPYLSDQASQLRYVHVESMSPDEYNEWLLAGWRRFGRDVFRPRCPACSECKSLRIIVDAFTPNRSQKRAERHHQFGQTRLEIGPPTVDRKVLDLHRRFHAAREQSRGWPVQTIDESTFEDAFVDNPFPSEQWRYYRNQQKLVGVGHVDALPAGLSAIYFVHDPDLAMHSLGIWNVLQLIAEARRRGLPHVYLGYWVAGCQSLAYKARFGPYEILGPDGAWRQPDPDA
jgi:arginine-tRNA-protein transferase